MPNRQPPPQGFHYPSNAEGLAHAVLLTAIVDVLSRAFADKDRFRRELLEVVEETVELTTFHGGQIEAATFAEIKADAVGRLRTIIAKPEGARRQ